MPRTLVPVLVPVRFADQSAPEPLRVEVVAQTAGEAVEKSQLIARHWLRLHHPDRSVAVDPGEALPSSIIVPGAHAYVLEPRGITVLEFPTRFDSENGERLGEAFARLDETEVYGVVLDCSALTYINTVGLTGIAAHLKRLRIHLVAVPPAIARVFDIVGLTMFLNLHANLREALEAIPDRG